MAGHLMTVDDMSGDHLKANISFQALHMLHVCICHAKVEIISHADDVGLAGNVEKLFNADVRVASSLQRLLRESKKIIQEGQHVIEARSLDFLQSVTTDDIVGLDSHLLDLVHDI
jgi:hypothetical protein